MNTLLTLMNDSVGCRNSLAGTWINIEANFSTKIDAFLGTSFPTGCYVLPRSRPSLERHATGGARGLLATLLDLNLTARMRSHFRLTLGLNGGFVLHLCVCRNLARRSFSAEPPGTEGS